MYELKVAVTKVLGQCTAEPPMKPGDYFTVREGMIRMPAGGATCMWAMQSLMPILTLKERNIDEEKEEDWVWRVHHVQCPDPDGRVIFKIGRIEEPEQEATSRMHEAGGREQAAGAERPRDLRVVVEEIRGTCTSGMQPGDYFTLHSGRLRIPADGHFCLYALQAVLPLLPAKQRPLRDDDWLKDACHVICPDPAGNVVMRIEDLG